MLQRLQYHKNIIKYSVKYLDNIYLGRNEGKWLKPGIGVAPNLPTGSYEWSISITLEYGRLSINPFNPLGAKKFKVQSECDLI